MQGDIVTRRVRASAYQTGWWKAPAATVHSAKLTPDSMVRNTRISNPVDTGPEAEGDGTLLA